MKILTVALVLLATTSSFAIEVKLTKDWKIWLTGESCEEVEQQTAAVKLWRARLGEEAAKTSGCECARRGCQVDVTETLPKFVKKVTGIFPENDGPNCFNTSLITVGILPHMRESSAQELTFWMNSPLCEKKGADAELSPGDILTVRSEYGKKEEHAFVFVTPELVFSKKTNSAEDAPSLLSLGQVLKQYPPSKGCETFKAGPECEHRIDAYSCETLEQYLQKNPKLGGSDALVASVERQEKRLETALFTSVDDFYRPILKILLPLSRTISLKLGDKGATDLNESDRLLLLGLKERIQSIKEQKGKFDSSK